ncbi:MAG: nitronate monooxygenase [Alphaproteobacteria bacterium CG11_big_fil_rev_8_21_14_0_20_44_7]|nr:MAG: nitronate monooxygenase [Alphaproteobacteria bacterium CG11_big_fil_rev_8_21_14_0_20_44_7]
MLEKLKKVKISGVEVLPIIEGGKGVSISTGLSAGAFAAAGAVGTFSGVNAEDYDDEGNPRYAVYNGKTRLERNRELIEHSIKAAISQAKIAWETSKGKGRIHMNVLWEMANCQEVLHGVLEKTKGMIHGITCGAGMPYKLAEIAEKYKVHYYPIVSSMRAFKILWKRSYSKSVDLLGGVVYEDPWKAGGHNGLSNAEDPEVFEDPYPRVAELRKFMNEVGLHEVPIVMAGGVWFLKEWEHWLDNPEIGPIVFQFGTRPIVTKESPVSDEWKKKLLTLEEGDVYLNRFSPTGFYSSAVENEFIKELKGREERQVPYLRKPDNHMATPLALGPRGREVFVTPEDREKVEDWIEQGFTEAMKTPDETLIFVTPEKAEEIRKDQVDCMGCLSHCKFSNWKDHDDYTIGHKPDPRSFCIQKTLQNIAHGNDIENELMFSGHNAYKFKDDPFYANGYVPTVQELVDRIMEGE